MSPSPWSAVANAAVSVRTLRIPSYHKLISYPGHPSCLQLADVAEILHSYAWVCIECKKCEFCHEKGADVRDSLALLLTR